MVELKCEMCGKASEDVSKVADPYEEEIHQNTIMMDYCNDCYCERCEDI